jgi:ribonuclease HI
MKNDIVPRVKDGRVVAFVDGSFDSKSQAYGSGILIYTPNNEIKELTKKGSNANYADQANVVGEIIAAMEAIDWAWKNEYSKVSVFYDYEGVQKWADGEWKTKNILTQHYKKVIDEKRDVIDIEFVKVSGHSNHIYNDRADKLAKAAIFENKILKDVNGNFGYIVSPAKDDEITKLLGVLKNDYEGFNYNVNDSENIKTWSLQFNKDKLKLMLHNNIKLVVQGKNSSLFQMVVSGVAEYVHSADVIQVLKNAYSMSLDKKAVENDLSREMPRLSNISLSENLLLFIKQAIINLRKYDSNDAEYTMYTLPALRALEGVLKFNLSKCSIHCSQKRFDVFEFDKNTKIHKLQNVHSGKLTVEQIAKIENCYNHLYNNRHTLFHFGIVMG